MGIEQGSGRVQFSAAEEQMVYTLAEWTSAFLSELNPVQRVIDQAEEHWIHEVFPEGTMQEHERAVWGTALRVVTRWLTARLAPLDDVETFKRALLEEVHAYPSAVVEARVGR
jgi:hypothetical protein